MALQETRDALCLTKQGVNFDVTGTTFIKRIFVFHSAQ